MSLCIITADWNESLDAALACIYVVRYDMVYISASGKIALDVSNQLCVNVGRTILCHFLRFVCHDTTYICS